ncbi:MAG: hypothetical protein B1H08_01825 [Candidatus Omnitrophica bacterium 4484_171]|nr:MAG: hypothetical protein B1H08_01825 [Candidatus Omnitrophica bacterium 4484_171]
MKRKVLYIILICILSLSLNSAVFAVGRNNAKDNSVKKDDIYKKLDLFGEALAVIQKKYVEEVPPKDLIYGSLNGLLFSLDPYSQFLDPDGYKELLVETEGKFGGLGIEITMRNGLLTIVSPIEDTPAWKAGLKAGDIIVKIDGKLTKEITLNGAVKKLRGKPGTKVKLTVLREKSREINEVTVTRGIIRIKDIKRAVILEDGVGYIRLTEFRENTAKDLNKALVKLKREGMKALILDLRNNPGGLLNSAVEVASEFLKDGKLIVYTKTRTGKEVRYTSLPMKDKFLNMPMVIMINRGSASGSEIVAAGLREDKRAILLGDKSFGKACVQTIIPLSDGSALRLTTAKYYTPLGHSIHEKGIQPDIKVTKEKVEKKEEDVFEAVKGKKKFNYTKDYQILRALDLVRGLLVLSSNTK